MCAVATSNRNDASGCGGIGKGRVNGTIGFRVVPLNRGDTLMLLMLTSRRLSPKGKATRQRQAKT